MQFIPKFPLVYIFFGFSLSLFLLLIVLALAIQSKQDVILEYMHVAGFLSEGEIFGITIFCGRGEARNVAGRIKDLVESDTNLDGKKEEMKVKYKVLSCANELESPNEMIRKAMLGTEQPGMSEVRMQVKKSKRKSLNEEASKELSERIEWTK